MKKSVAITVIVLLLISFYIWNPFKSRYVYENGTWNYISYDTGAGRRVSPINVNKNEFKVLKYNDFARDNKSVYFKNEKIEGSDPNTFQVISDKGRYRYAKDKNNVYIYTSDDWSINTVINADPASFEVLEFPYSKDKNDAYCGNLPLYVDDVSKFEVIESAGYAMMSSVDSFLSKHESNREKYGFITNWVLYSEDGKAKTEKLNYEGYMLIEDNR